MLLDTLLPKYAFSETHSTLVDAPPDRVLGAIRRVTPGEMPIVRFLFAVRSLPARAVGRRGLPARKSEPLLEQMLDSGFLLLAEEPGVEVVVGVVGQMFTLRGDAAVIQDAPAFMAFTTPGYAKVAMNFAVHSTNGRTRLTTETRVLTTDPVTRRRFGRYWRVIRPGSAVIRRSWIKAARHRVMDSA